ncbi:cysteine rich protein having a signal peptide [Cryptosporidium felis]|nr:cysteine rich protein having a signal peptide [Cryptosporidium felis]
MYIPGLKRKKITEKSRGESILDLFMNLKHSVKATSRRMLGWAIELPFPGSEESKAMLMLGYSLNTADVRSTQNPRYIRMFAILNSKKFILPKTAYNIWRDSVLSIGIDILPPFSPSLVQEIVSRSEKDLTDLKINCGKNNEDVDSLALELLSVAHENNLTELKFYQFCKPSEALVGTRSEDFYSSCIEALKFIPEFSPITGKPTGKYLSLSSSKISKLCRNTPRWESISTGISYASLIMEDRPKKEVSNRIVKPQQKSTIIADRNIYSYVIKTATRSALERSAASEQICRQFKTIYSEEKMDRSYEGNIDMENVQRTANILFRTAVSLLDEDKQLTYLLSGNTQGSKPITFESFCSLVLALSKIERRYLNGECARNLRLMFRQNVIVSGKVRLATIKSKTVIKLCMSLPYFEKCGNNLSSEVDEISFELLLGTQKLRFSSITFRHLCGVVKNIRRAEIKGLIPKGQKHNTNISSFFNSDCIYGLRTLSVGARHAEIICSGSRFWVMCGHFIDSEVDALASQLYSEVVQNTGLARFMTTSLFELADFCPIAEVLIHEIDSRYFNRECVNALAAISISKDYGKSICQSSRHWQGTCSGIIEEDHSIIERIDPIAGGLFSSAQDLGYLDLLFTDFCDSAREIFALKEVTETGQILEGHETSMFQTDCPKILSNMIQSLSEDYISRLSQFKNTKSIKSVSSENFERAELICQNFFNYYDPNYGSSQLDEYDDAKFRLTALEKKSAEEGQLGNFLKGKSHDQRMARRRYSNRFNWANAVGDKLFIPGYSIDKVSRDLTGYSSDTKGVESQIYIPLGGIKCSDDDKCQEQFNSS